MESQMERGVGIRVSVGMRVSGLPFPSDDFVDGVVVSVAEHGCFIREAYTGAIIGVTWESLTVYSEGAQFPALGEPVWG